MIVNPSRLSRTSWADSVGIYCRYSGWESESPGRVYCCCFERRKGVHFGEWGSVWTQTRPCHRHTNSRLRPLLAVETATQQVKSWDVEAPIEVPFQRAICINERKSRFRSEPETGSPGAAGEDGDQEKIQNQNPERDEAL